MAAARLLIFIQLASHGGRAGSHFAYFTFTLYIPIAQYFFCSSVLRNLSLSKSRKPIQRPISPIMDEMVDDFEGLDSDEPMEKDETETKLDKLVFGDKSGFYEGLDSYNGANDDIRGLVDGDQQHAQDGLEEGNFEGLDDADVCNVETPVRLAFAQHLFSCSFLTPPRPLRMSQTF